MIERGSGRVTAAYTVRETRRPGSLLLPKGTLTVGYFQEHRNYNIYHFVTPTGDTLVIYFNVCDQTQASTTEIKWRDLEVDILVTPQQGCEILGEEELPDDLGSALARLITDTRDYIVLHHRELAKEAERKSAAHIAGLIQEASLDS